MVKVQITNHFAAPPEYVRDWLLDYKEDDSAKYFGDPAPRIAKKKGKEIHLVQDGAMGHSEAVITPIDASSWKGTTKFSKKGKTFMMGTLHEQVAAEGAKSTRHVVTLTLEPKSLMMKLMAPMMGPKVKKDVTNGFAKIKADLEADFKAGKPPK